MTTNREGAEQTEQNEEQFEGANEVITPAAEISEVVAVANAEMEEVLENAKEATKSVESGFEFESLKSVREEFGTLNSRIGPGTGFHGESFDPYFSITTTSFGSRGEDGGAFIDMVMAPEQAMKLYESLGRIMDDVNGAETPVEATRPRRYMGGPTKLAKARTEFGTLTASKVMANFSENFNGTGPKVIIITESAGRRGPKGSAPIDLAISIDDAKKLFASLSESKADIEKNIVEEED